MLDVVKIETKLRRDARRAMKLLDDAADFSIGEQRKIARQAEAPIQNGMAIHNARLRALLRIRLAVAARMRELQSNQQSPVATRGLLVLRDQGGTQLRESRARMLRDYQLIRIRACAVRNGDGFAAPN